MPDASVELVLLSSRRRIDDHTLTFFGDVVLKDETFPLYSTLLFPDPAEETMLVGFKLAPCLSSGGPVLLNRATESQEFVAVLWANRL